jgi:hypothetical protein
MCLQGPVAVVFPAKVMRDYQNKNNKEHLTITLKKLLPVYRYCIFSKDDPRFYWIKAVLTFEITL